MYKSQQWKAAERELAKAMGGIRTGPRGTNTPDVIHDLWCPEVKYGQARWFTSVLEKDLKQAETNARGKRWFVYLREAITGRRMVVIPYKYFLELLEHEREMTEQIKAKELERMTNHVR